MRKSVIEKLERIGTCEEGLKWISSQSSIEEAWKNCTRGDWMLWYIAKNIKKKQGPAHKKMVLCCCKVARQAIKHVEKGEKRPLNAIQKAESWAKNKGATIEDVRVAAEAASAHTAAHTASAHTAAHTAYASAYANAAVAYAASHASASVAYAYASAAYASAAYAASASAAAAATAVVANAVAYSAYATASASHAAAAATAVVANAVAYSAYATASASVAYAAAEAASLKKSADIVREFYPNAPRMRGK